MCISPMYGDFGFKDDQEVNQRARDIHIHNDPIDREVFAREVLPWQPRLEAFYRPSVVDLQNILGTFAMQQIEEERDFLQQPQTEGGGGAASRTSSFLRLTSLARSTSSNWSDVVELLSALHSLHHRVLLNRQ
jgi:hypothetical protein